MIALHENTSRENRDPTTTTEVVTVADMAAEEDTREDVAVDMEEIAVVEDHTITEEAIEVDMEETVEDTEVAHHESSLPERSFQVLQSTSGTFSSMSPQQISIASSVNSVPSKMSSLLLMPEA